MTKGKKVIRKATARGDSHRTFESMSAALRDLKRSVGSRSCLRTAIKNRIEFAGFQWAWWEPGWEMCQMAPGGSLAVRPQTAVAIYDHVFCCDRTKTLLMLLQCQNLVEMCQMVETALPRVTREPKRMKNIWNPYADGDCFFACVFNAFVYIIANLSAGEITPEDRGVSQTLGSKMLRYLFWKHFNSSQDDEELMGALQISMMPDPDKELMGALQFSMMPDNASCDMPSVSSCLEDYANTSYCCGQEPAIICKFIPAMRFVITTQLESSNRHLVIENRAGQINENSGGSAYTVQDEFAIHLTKTDMGGGHYKMNLF